MTEEFMDERERDFLDYLRNNLVDPENRGNVATETFVATAGQTVFTLTNVLVKNVADTITVNAITKYKGYDYTVQYGEGNNATTVTLNTGALVGQSVVIHYHYGQSMIEREFSRSDVTLPRIVVMFITGSEEFAALGDDFESGKGSYMQVAYRLEIRDKFATRARHTAAHLVNLIKKMRHANLYRTNITRASDIQNFDYDNEKNAYIWQFTAEIEWEVVFQ